ncbi:MAG: PIG-L family deacetylase [Candidatus Pedobacter colombiensis]|uniref:PIG-L family deacetylase n=1 Tax=Candidatus Pedobacter colombiensis TaxID=3121371 RepID=A0AAJ5W8N0_9SPHI|nr:PIG-L family deacetylase [Pedobacter sp.]WEK20693.1 MAG: PIG-L family deacetylase [Pedobacter sp.]
MKLDVTSENKTKKVAVIVAHPDDEVLWAGGTLLAHPDWQCFIACLSRKSDPDRAPKFQKSLAAFHSKGAMGDLDDGPAQIPQDKQEITRVLLELLPNINYDLIITHNPSGEYTRHLRHEEVGITVLKLWHEGKLSSKETWTFAYEDGNRMYFPQALKTTGLYFDLPEDLWNIKYQLITEVYGFEQDSWEAKATPKAEAFWKLTSKKEVLKWIEKHQIS